MKERKWRSDVRVVSDTAADETSAEASADDTFAVTVIGDFRGASGSPRAEPARPIPIDRDDFDSVLAKLALRWSGSLRSASGEEVPVELSFREIDDFHPDRVIEQIPVLRRLADARRALNDPSRFETAAREIRGWAPARPGKAAPPRRPDHVKPGNVLDAILGEEDAPVAPATPPGRPPDLQRFLEDVVGPHLVRVDRARQAELVAAVDASLQEQMCSILHAPGFRALEAAWRALRWLVFRAETGERSKVRLLPITREGLLEDLRSGSAPEESLLARLLLGPTSVPGTERPSLLVGLYELGPEKEDLLLLDRIGFVAEALRAPFIAGAAPGLVGCRSFTDFPPAGELEALPGDVRYEVWQTLRLVPRARWLALACPRWLVRLPYGAGTDPIESFGFEEDAEGDHEALLWASPAIAVAAVLAEGFANEGPSLDLGSSVRRLEGLPLYVRREGGESRIEPCAEVFLGEPQVGALEDLGLLPLVSYRQADWVAMPSLQTIAKPRAPLRLRGR